MALVLRVLFVEDSEADAQIVLRELRRGGYQVEHERVDTLNSMQAALSRGPWDVVLCDYTLPQFNAMEALKSLHASGLDLPFIVISGTISEDRAVETLKAGAHDFIVKGRLARLIPAIERELRDAQIRQKHREAEAERKNLMGRLDVINAEIERFAYTAFHDLRAPLVTIKGFLGTLRNDLEAGRQDEAKKDLQRVEAAAAKMDKILSDLLELARVGRISKPPEEVDLYALVQEILQDLEARIRAAGVAVNISTNLPILFGDRVRLREVLENLIENAVKFTRGQAHPLIEIGAKIEGGEQIVFVKDNGVGIDPRYHNRIFNLFEKLEPNIEGTGIGLTIAKRIIEVHGGRIWVESNGQGRGSTFAFTIPDDRPRPAPK